jgi:hypothetical protein
LTQTFIGTRILTAGRAELSNNRIITANNTTQRHHHPPQTPPARGDMMWVWVRGYYIVEYYIVIY